MYKFKGGRVDSCAWTPLGIWDQCRNESLSRQVVVLQVRVSFSSLNRIFRVVTNCPLWGTTHPEVVYTVKGPQTPSSVSSLGVYPILTTEGGWEQVQIDPTRDVSLDSPGQYTSYREQVIFERLLKGNRTHLWFQKCYRAFREELECGELERLR